MTAPDWPTQREDGLARARTLGVALILAVLYIAALIAIVAAVVSHSTARETSWTRPASTSSTQTTHSTARPSTQTVVLRVTSPASSLTSTRLADPAMRPVSVAPTSQPSEPVVSEARPGDVAWVALLVVVAGVIGWGVRHGADGAR